MYVTFKDIRTFDVVGRESAPGRANADESGDESLGRLHDLYLDTRDWRVSWLVLESGGLLNPRKVLIGSERRVAFDTDARQLLTDLAPYDIETARQASELRTVSEQRSGENTPPGGGVPPTADMGDMGGGMGGGMAGAGGAPLVSDAGESLPPSEEERHLRSVRELIGYTVYGQGGEEVGPVADLLIDTDSPAIAWLAIDVGSWLAGREVVVRPDWCTDLSWSERAVSLDLSREQVRGAPPLETLGGLDRAYASSLARFYRLPPL